MFSTRRVKSFRNIWHSKGEPQTSRQLQAKLRREKVAAEETSRPTEAKWTGGWKVQRCGWRFVTEGNRLGFHCLRPS